MSYNVDEMDARLRHLEKLQELQQKGVDKRVIQAFEMAVVPELAALSKNSLKLHYGEENSRIKIDPSKDDVVDKKYDATQLSETICVGVNSGKKINQFRGHVDKFFHGKHILSNYVGNKQIFSRSIVEPHWSELKSFLEKHGYTTKEKVAW